jgi:hypothetical protein
MEQNKEESSKPLVETPLSQPVPPPQRMRQRQPVRDETWDHRPKRESNSVPEIYRGWSEPF